MQEGMSRANDLKKMREVPLKQLCCSGSLLQCVAVGRSGLQWVAVEKIMNRNANN